jgi:GNAT superfamily N-acetyltransferase
VADVSVRPARTSDAAAIAEVQLTTWKAAYGELLPPEALALDPGDVAAAWEQAVSAPPSPYHRVLVAVEGDEVVGLASCEPAADEDLEVPSAELGALLVEPRWGRRGHGSRLVAAAVDLWREDEVEQAVTWVFDTDEVVEAFLTSAGWGPDAVARTLESGATTVRQRRWHTAL